MKNIPEWKQSFFTMDTKPVKPGQYKMRQGYRVKGHYSN